MSPQPTLVELIWFKFGEASFFHDLLERHQEKQKLSQSPPAREFSYYLSAFLSAAITVTT